MTKRTIVVTGASDGIGAAAARALNVMNESVIIVGRSPEKTKALANELDVPYYVADFTNLSEVRRLAGILIKNHPRIDVLVNNAGGIMGKREVTIDGHEKTMQVNYLAPFLLTNLLLDTLIRSKATVINTSSAAAKIFSKFHIDDIENENHYSANKAYGNAKLENILFTTELNRRYGSQGISAVAFHPGVVATNFSPASPMLKLFYDTALKRLLLTPAQGADTLVWLATNQPGSVWKPGGYYAKRMIAKTHSKAYDTATAKQLWDSTEIMIRSTK